MRRISMVLALALAFCMTLSACQTESIPEGSTSESLHAADVVPEDQVDLKESKELVVYRYPLLGEQLDFAVEQFKKQYPDVEIEYRDFGDASDPNASDQYAEILQGELAAGKGPDIIVAPTYAISSDFSKTEETGAFLDVRAKLMQDTELSMDMFVDGWLSIGGVGEQQCFIPLSYQTRVLFADQTVLQENGVERETLSDPVGFHSTIDRWMETKEGDMTLWDAHSYGLWLVLPWCGAEAVDYENHTLNLNDDFRNTMELYKSLYDSDMVKPQSEGWVDPYSNVYSGEAGRNLSQGMHLFLLGQDNLLSFLIAAVLQAGVLGFVIPPCAVARQIREQVFPHILVLRPDEAQPQKKGAEGKGRVFADLGFSHHCPALVDRLCGDRQRQRDICPYLACMKRALEAAPFQCAAIKHGMEVQGVIPGPVVMLIAFV